jgi:hypothetical protein
MGESWEHLPRPCGRGLPPKLREQHHHHRIESRARRSRMARRRPRRGAAAAEAGALMYRAGGQQFGKSRRGLRVTAMVFHSRSREMARVARHREELRGGVAWPSSRPERIRRGQEHAGPAGVEREEPPQHQREEVSNHLSTIRCAGMGSSNLASSFP